MKKTFYILSSLRSPYGCVKKTLGVILIGSFILSGNYCLASVKAVDVAPSVKAINSKDIFNQAIDDYFAGRYTTAQAGYDRLKGTDYVALSAVPSAINFVAQDNFPEAKRIFSEIKASPNVRDREYAQLWELWLTAKQWSGSNKELNKELTRLVDSQTWHLPHEKALASLYAGRGTVDSVFSAVSAFDADAVQKQDAMTEATFFAGGYLQNVKHDNAAAKQLFNDNLNKLNSVSLERPLIDRDCAALNKLTHKSK